MTKQQVINKVKDLEEDNKALWHWCKCLDEQLIKQQEEISKLYEEMRQMQQDSKSNAG